MSAIFNYSVLVWAFSIGTAWCSLVPYGLECEARQNPIGIDTGQPRLGWKLRSEQPNQRQSGYEIEVATSPDKLAGGMPDAWSSGRVASAQTAWIPCAGSRLESFRRYWWRVRVWDGAMTASDWSQPAEWITSLVEPSRQKGSWIASPNTSLRSGPLPIFRKEFVIDRPLRQALAMISGAGFHELRVNGTKVGDHVLAPAWTNFRATMLYETFDVSPLLRSGRNALGVLIGNGFYNVAGGRYAKYTGSFGQPRLWLQLHLRLRGAFTTSAKMSLSANWTGRAKLPQPPTGAGRLLCCRMTARRNTCSGQVTPRNTWWQPQNESAKNLAIVSCCRAKKPSAARLNGNGQTRRRLRPLSSIMLLKTRHWRSSRPRRENC